MGGGGGQKPCTPFIEAKQMIPTQCASLMDSLAGWILRRMGVDGSYSPGWKGCGLQGVKNILQTWEVVVLAVSYFQNAPRAFWEEIHFFY